MVDTVAKWTKLSSFEKDELDTGNLNNERVQDLGLRDKLPNDVLKLVFGQKQSEVEIALSLGINVPDVEKLKQQGLRSLAYTKGKGRKTLAA